MLIAFLIIFFVINELVISTATHQQLGFNPYPFGTTILCMIIHAIMLVVCIWYCGWIFGILLFLFHLFAFPHSTIGWILNSPSLFYSPEKMLGLCKREIALLPVAIITLLAFTIISFFATPYKALYEFAKTTPLFLIIAGAVLVLGFIIRSIISYKISADENF
ncbi:MAG: hypothetical protein J6B86_04365 [Clostridia bacterium]|nr:hypothetical protein [Clostridia bacterium]